MPYKYTRWHRHYCCTIARGKEEHAIHKGVPASPRPGSQHASAPLIQYRTLRRTHCKIVSSAQPLSSECESRLVSPSLPLSLATSRADQPHLSGPASLPPPLLAPVLCRRMPHPSWRSWLPSLGLLLSRYPLPHLQIGSVTAAKPPARPQPAPSGAGQGRGRAGAGAGAGRHCGT
jgi:hypothetical protein